MGIKERIGAVLQKIGEGLTLVDEDGQPNFLPFADQKVLSEIEKIANNLWEIKNYKKPWMFFPCPDPKNPSNHDGTQIGVLTIKWTEKSPGKKVKVKVYPVFRDPSGNLSLGTPSWEEIRIHPFSPFYYL